MQLSYCSLKGMLLSWEILHAFLLSAEFLAQLHEVQRAIVVTTIVGFPILGGRGQNLVHIQKIGFLR